MLEALSCKEVRSRDEDGSTETPRWPSSLVWWTPVKSAYPRGGDTNTTPPLNLVGVVSEEELRAGCVADLNKFAGTSSLAAVGVSSLAVCLMCFAAIIKLRSLFFPDLGGVLIGVLIGDRMGDLLKMTGDPPTWTGLVYLTGVLEGDASDP